MKVAQQINESSYDSYKSFIKALKPIVKDNFKSFVPNKAPDPNEYKEINLEGVIFGDFPQKGVGIYVIKFDFQDGLCAIKLGTDTTTHDLKFGLGKWIFDQTTKRGPYLVAGAKANRTG